MTRMPARAAQTPRLDRAREFPGLPDENDPANVRSKNADDNRAKTGTYGSASEARETPKPSGPGA